MKKKSRIVCVCADQSIAIVTHTGGKGVKSLKEGKRDVCRKERKEQEVMKEKLGEDKEGKKKYRKGIYELYSRTHIGVSPHFRFTSVTFKSQILKRVIRLLQVLLRFDA